MKRKMNSNDRNVVNDKELLYHLFDRSRFAYLDVKISLNILFFPSRKKNPKIAWQNPRIPSQVPNSQELGKNPKQWEHCVLDWK
jgi:hypothetical protein